MKRLVVIGASGQLGSEIVKVFKSSSWEVRSLVHRDIEVSSPQSIKNALLPFNPEVVINTAAFHDLNACEQDPQKAMTVNAWGVKYLADWCTQHRATLVHISTDFVFGGNLTRRKQYKEKDQIFPQSAYAISKAAGEMILQSSRAKYILIRTSGLYSVAGSSVKGGNFVDLMITKARRREKIKVVNDQIVSPTYAKNVAENLNLLLKSGGLGLYHMTSQGKCSWYMFAKTIFKLAGLNPSLIAVKTEAFDPQPVRPQYSVLENSRLVQRKLDKMAHWRENLKLYLKEKGHI